MRLTRSLCRCLFFIFLRRADSFWGAERKFWTADGVYTTSVGYAGGNKENPTYRQVCSGRTGHAEVCCTDRVLYTQQSSCLFVCRCLLVTDFCVRFCMLAGC